MLRASAALTAGLAIRRICALYDIAAIGIVGTDETSNTIEVATKVSRYVCDEIAWAEIVAPGIVIDGLACRGLGRFRSRALGRLGGWRGCRLMGRLLRRLRSRRILDEWRLRECNISGVDVGSIGRSDLLVAQGWACGRGFASVGIATDNQREQTDSNNGNESATETAATFLFRFRSCFHRFPFHVKC